MPVVGVPVWVRRITTWAVLAVAASMTMLVRRRAGQPAGVLCWVALLLGLGASLAANVAAAEPTVVGRLVAAWPPVGLLLSYELLMQQHGARGGPGLRTVRSGAVSDPSMEATSHDRHDQLCPGPPSLRGDRRLDGGQRLLRYLQLRMVRRTA
jgi:hypothetical protein